MRRATASVAPAASRRNFYPRSPCGERQCTPWNSPTLCYFYPRSPCGERLSMHTSLCCGCSISIHALLAESDYNTESRIAAENDFYPRSPCGERPDTRPPNLSSMSISIHALLAESDWDSTGGLNYDVYFYPRSPCGERHLHPGYCAFIHAFLSTLSLRRATITRIKICIDNADFYPRSPCGERLTLI